MAVLHFERGMGAACRSNAQAYANVPVRTFGRQTGFTGGMSDGTMEMKWAS